jgi:hypothetical protein
MAGLAYAKPTGANMMGPMQEGNYVAISPGGGACRLRVERFDPNSQPLAIAPAMFEASGLTQELLDKFNHPAWQVILQMETPGKEAREAVIFATRLAQRLAALGDGIVMDSSGFRFFGPQGWPVEDPMPEFDAREYVHVHIEAESRWFHTHGLIKFGRPELEIYDVPSEMDHVAYATLLDIAQYVITTAMVEPGQTCGDPNQPFYAREGTKNQDDHWNETAVLELVDVDEQGKPVESGAPKALQATAVAE